MNTTIEELIERAMCSFAVRPNAQFQQIVIDEVLRCTKKKITDDDIESFMLKHFAHQIKMYQSESNRTIKGGERYIGVNHGGSQAGKKPQWFSLSGKKYMVKSWVELLITLCNVINEENPDCFHLVDEKIVGKTRVYISSKKDQLRVPKPIKDSSLYIESNLSANNIKELAQELADFFGYSKLEIEYWW